MRVLCCAVLVLAMALTACNRKGAGKPDGKLKKPALVTVARAIQQPMTLDVTGVGHAEPVESVGLRPQVTGTLLRVLFREGDAVRRGQSLFTIDQGPLAASLRQAEAVLRRDQAQHALALAQVRRYEALFRNGDISREELDQHRTNASALAATLQSDRAVVDQARVQLGYTTISAPISGRTGSLNATAGNLVRPTDTVPLVVINQTVPMRVAFTVAEKHLAVIRQGQRAGGLGLTATPQGSKTATSGRLTFINNTVDRSTGTILLKGIFANTDQQLWPGQYVTTVLTLARQAQALVIPAQAVQNGQKGPFVFVVTSDSAAEARPVTLDRIQDGLAVIGQGLAVGETVVTDGQLQVVPGKPVAIVRAGKPS